MIMKFGLGVLSFLCSIAVNAQEYPTKPIRLIVSNTPGSGPDITARLLSADMSKFLGQPVVVENRPSSDESVGYEFVAKLAPADGYTLVSVTVPSLAILPLARKDLRFDAWKDLTPFLGIAETRFLLVSSSTLPWKTFAEFVAEVKAKPGKYNYATTSSNSLLQTASIKHDMGLDMVRIPYNGGGPLMQAITASEVHMAMVGGSTAITLGEKIRILGVSGEQRRPPFLASPTFREIGLPQLQPLSFSLSVRSGTPKLILDKLYAAGSQALRQPEVRARLEKAGFDIIEQNPDVAAKKLDELARIFADMANKAGMKPE